MAQALHKAPEPGEIVVRDAEEHRSRQEAGQQAQTKGNGAHGVRSNWMT